MENELQKIAYGSKVTIFSLNGSGSIPILYGGYILIAESSEELISENNFNLVTEGDITSINIKIENADSTLQQLYNFPLEEGQILGPRDYIDADGLHIDETVVAFTNRQQEAYNKLQNISLYEGINHIVVTDKNSAFLKVTYSSTEGEDESIYVLDKNEQLIAIFNKDDEDTLINPRIEKKQNSEAIFTFTIDTKNPKWEQINNPENLYLVDGMIFSTNFDGSFTEKISENDEQTVEITAYERQQLLSRKFVRAWNSETGLEKIDTFMVVILSNGNLALKNNDVIINTNYPKGSSGYALEGLLYGTGWTVGICDIYEYESGKLVKDENGNPVYAKFDLETDQMDIYSNILKIQELWGGILIFDSMNKIVHHRDETTYLPYNGYEVKYQKNMQSLEKTYNNKIITKLCPLGEGGLNIKSVNNNNVWLENYSYTSTILEGIENNPDITDPVQLKRWGKRKLQMLCRPSIELNVNVALLYQVEGYELEDVDLNDIVKVIDYQKALPSLIISENTIIGEDAIIGGVSSLELRVTEFSYLLWNKSDATIKLSNITLDSTDIFRKTIIATNTINAGTLDAAKVVTLYRGGESVERTMFGMDSEISEKVGEKEIISKINQTPEIITINADKIGISANDVLNILAGNTIDLTSKSIVIDSDNFKVDAEGNAIMYNATITGGKLDVEGFDDNETVINLTNYTSPSMGQGVQTGVEISSEGIEIYKETFEQGQSTGKISTKILANNQKVLWSGAMFMNGSQTATLSENISNQTNGIILIWSDYSNDQANDWGFNFTFIPKTFITLGFSGSGMVCQMSTGQFATIGTKYIYIYDNRIIGNEGNVATGTNNGIVYANNRFALRRIIGV